MTDKSNVQIELQCMSVIQCWNVKCSVNYTIHNKKYFSKRNCTINDTYVYFDINKI